MFNTLIIMKAEFNNCFMIHSKYFPVLKGVSPFVQFPLTKNNTDSSPDFLGQRFNNLQHFWRHRDVIGLIWQNFWRHHRRFNMTKFFPKFDQQQLVMLNYACGFNQSETWNVLNPVINVLILYERSKLLKTRGEISYLQYTIFIILFIIL